MVVSSLICVSFLETSGLSGVIILSDDGFCPSRLLVVQIYKKNLICLSHILVFFHFFRLHLQKHHFNRSILFRQTLLETQVLPFTLFLRCNVSPRIRITLLILVSKAHLRLGRGKVISIDNILRSRIFFQNWRLTF